MTCETFHSLVLDAVEGGQAGDASAQEIEEHVVGCPACAQILRAIRRQSDLLFSLARPAAPPALWARIQEQLRDREILRRHAPSAPLKWIGMAAALLLTLLGLLALTRTNAPAPPSLIVEIEDVPWTSTIGRMMPGYENPQPAPPLVKDVLALNR